MRLIVFVFALAALSTAVLAGDEKGPGKPKKKQPPPPGIHWEVGLEAGLARATREGRPVFIAVNALETERANQLLAAEPYRSAAWGQATRGYPWYATRTITATRGRERAPATSRAIARRTRQP